MEFLQHLLVALTVDIGDETGEIQPEIVQIDIDGGVDILVHIQGEGHAADRVLTPEEEKANAEAYAMKQQEREQRIAEQESKVPEAPSMTPEERIQARAERRAAAEKKRAENIKKRAEKAAEYERQVKLREEQEKKNSVTGDLIPRL